MSRTAELVGRSGPESRTSAFSVVSKIIERKEDDDEQWRTDDTGEERQPGARRAHSC